MKTPNKYTEGLLNNDSKIIEEIYQNVGASVKNYIVKRGGKAEEAADVFQEGLMVVWMQLKKGNQRHLSNFKGYLFGVCRNIWLKKINRQKVIIEGDLLLINEEGAQDVLFEDDAGLEQLISQEAAQDIGVYQLFKAGFSRLSERCRNLLTLQNKGFDYEQIRVKLDFPSVTRVGKKRHDCVKQLKKIVREDPGFENIYAL